MELKGPPLFPTIVRVKFRKFKETRDGKEDTQKQSKGGWGFCRYKNKIRGGGDFLAKRFKIVLENVDFRSAFRNPSKCPIFLANFNRPAILLRGDLRYFAGCWSVGVLVSAFSYRYPTS